MICGPHLAKKKAPAHFERQEESESGVSDAEVDAGGAMGAGSIIGTHNIFSRISTARCTRARRELWAQMRKLGGQCSCPANSRIRTLWGPAVAQPTYLLRGVRDALMRVAVGTSKRT